MVFPLNRIMKSAPENSFFSTNQTLNIQGRLFDLTTPLVMAVLNVTPDSFYDGGRYQTESAILNQVEKLLDEGATFIDVGAYSSRPGASDISVEEESKRALFALKTIIRNFPHALLSIDTFRSEVAYAAVNEGACDCQRHLRLVNRTLKCSTRLPALAFLISRCICGEIHPR